MQNPLHKFETNAFLLTVLVGSISVLVAVGVFLLLQQALEVSSAVSALAAGTIWLALTLLFSVRLVKALLQPTESVYRALDHISAEPNVQAPPSAEGSGLSKQVVAHMLDDIYKLSAGQSSAQAELSTSKEFIETIMNLHSNALVVLDRNAQVAFVNQKAKEVILETVDDPSGMTLADAINPTFTSGIPFDEWLSKTQADKIQDRYLWQKVKVTRGQDNVRYFDMVADYNKNESHGIEVIVALTDKTEEYHQDDTSIGFVSMAVHELRAPISLLRGYIELFEDEIGEKLDAEQKVFMNKMAVAAGQLSSFMNNILNVAKAEKDQLKVHIQEDSMIDVINQSAAEFNLRAKVKNRKINFILPQQLPTVGIDRVSMYEVMSNLIDNAIKYSHDCGEINVKAEVNQEGLVQISIQDFGVGIPASSLENLFEQFFRSHHSRDAVAGTGLGLYLSKTIVEAHGGNIWVQSEEGQGSTFGFNLPTYASIKDQTTEDGTPEIVHSAHGWIKNHGRVRR